MRFHQLPRPLLQLITSILLLPTITANPRPDSSELAGFAYDELFARWDCGGQYCGVSSQVCCSAGSTCYTNALDQAACGAGTVYAATTTQAASGGYWQYYTSTYDLTMTSTYSSFVGGVTVVVPAATTTAGACQWNACGNTCCGTNEYCYAAGVCSPAAYGSSVYATLTTTTAGATAGAPIRGTSASTVITTQTQSPTSTVPFESPVATGANITLTSQQVTGGGGLSGGAIAGIVIGVLVGLALLALILFYCCLRGLLDGCLALFGLGGRKRRRTEVEEYERRSHHSSGGGGGGAVKRTWYGAARPSGSRFEERTEKRRSGGGQLLGIAGGLAALWAILGLKRRNKRRNEEKYSEYSGGSSYGYSSYGKSHRPLTS